ncbi:MAG: hypothetical protein ACJ8GW_17905 [Massilia sp.]
MFWIRHPQPLLSTRAVAMQVVSRKAQVLPDLHTIVVKTASATGEQLLTLADDAAQAPGGILIELSYPPG